MKITKVELYHVAIPLKKTFYPAWIPGYPQTKNQFTLAVLTTDTGLTGISAGMAFNEEREGLGKLLAPYLLGSDPCDIDLIHQRMFEGTGRIISYPLLNGLSLNSLCSVIPAVPVPAKAGIQCKNGH